MVDKIKAEVKSIDVEIGEFDFEMTLQNAEELFNQLGAVLRKNYPDSPPWSEGTQIYCSTEEGTK